MPSETSNFNYFRLDSRRPMPWRMKYARHRTYTIGVDVNQDEDMTLPQYIHIHSAVKLAALLASSG